MAHPEAPHPASSPTRKWRRRALEALPAVLLLSWPLWMPLLVGHRPRPEALVTALGPFAGSAVVLGAVEGEGLLAWLRAWSSADWSAGTRGLFLRSLPVALAGLATPAIVFWFWPRWDETAGGLRAIALAVGALLWCAAGAFTAMMSIV